MCLLLLDAKVQDTLTHLDFEKPVWIAQRNTSWKMSFTIFELYNDKRFSKNGLIMVNFQRFIRIYEAFW